MRNEKIYDLSLDNDNHVVLPLKLRTEARKNAVFIDFSDIRPPVLQRPR